MVQERLRTPDLQGQYLRVDCLNCNCAVWLYSHYLTQRQKLEAGNYVTEIMSYWNTEGAPAEPNILKV